MSTLLNWQRDLFLLKGSMPFAFQTVLSLIVFTWYTYAIFRFVYILCHSLRRYLASKLKRVENILTVTHFKTLPNDQNFKFLLFCQNLLGSDHSILSKQFIRLHYLWIGFVYLKVASQKTPNYNFCLNVLTERWFRNEPLIEKPKRDNFKWAIPASFNFRFIFSTVNSKLIFYLNNFVGT